MVPLFDPEKRAEIVRPKMMKDGKYLITRIGGSIQEADPNKILDAYFRYKNYISGDNEFENEWFNANLKDVWSNKFLGLVKDFRSRPIPNTDQRLWYNKILPSMYSKKMLSKFCCEVPL